MRQGAQGSDVGSGQGCRTVLTLCSSRVLPKFVVEERNLSWQSHAGLVQRRGGEEFRGISPAPCSSSLALWLSGSVTQRCIIMPGFIFAG